MDDSRQFRGTDNYQMGSSPVPSVRKVFSGADPTNNGSWVLGVNQSLALRARVKCAMNGIWVNSARLPKNLSLVGVHRMSLSLSFPLIV